MLWKPDMQINVANSLKAQFSSIQNIDLDGWGIFFKNLPSLPFTSKRSSKITKNWPFASFFPSYNW